MSKINDGWELIARDLENLISDILDQVGIHYRLFCRIKEDKSIINKIERKKKEHDPYSQEGKKIQDFIGVRVVTYFQDDIQLVQNILTKKFTLIDDSSIDTLAPSEFRPKRTNIIYSLDNENSKRFEETVNSSKKEFLKLIDSSFELQLRTILSEGWHEIEHSLRYKCQKEWEPYNEKSRLLNGIYATLETSDVALKTLFNELAYSHFKAKNWEGLLRTKFRIKFKESSINSEIMRIMDENLTIGKKIVKMDRELFLFYIASLNISLPINFDNIIYFLNKYEIKDHNIDTLTPPIYNEL